MPSHSGSRRPWRQQPLGLDPEEVVDFLRLIAEGLARGHGHRSAPRVELERIDVVLREHRRHDHAAQPIRLPRQRRSSPLERR